ncbi:MAG TPA: GDSL-type esterase/lipase family protein [Ohtaekwangia sp.]|nr:GDSL-type esterase/lipase family protein [Ohtaekwangia sp.]
MNNRNYPDFKRTFLVAMMLLHLSLCVYAQLSATATFISPNDNVIANYSGLDPFFEKLYTLETGKNSTINIVHIGDSHIQADYLTEVVRRNLQQVFGNAGRGLIVPYRVAGTNEPANFRSESFGHWDAKRVVHPFKPLPVGVGGITLHTNEEGSGFSIRMTDAHMDYAFNKVSIFALNDKGSFRLSIMDSARAELARIAGTDEKHFFYEKIQLPVRLNHVILEGIREDNTQNHFTLFGLNFENDQSGILYHAIGVNGAKYEHYNKAELFSKQTTWLNPDLFIISLGTNESMDYPGINRNFASEISNLIESLHLNNPDACFMLITPPDAFQKRVRPNPGIEKVRGEILSIAVENGFAFWDMYRVNGGKDSAFLWKEKGLLRPDGVHFTREGYALQGEMLYEAIMKSYRAYVATRNP